MQTIWTSLQRHLLAYLSDNRVMVCLNDNHRKFGIFHEVSSLGVEDFEADAAVATEFVLFLHTHLDLDIFGDPQTYLLRQY